MILHCLLPGTDQPKRVFISYARQDYDAASRLYEDLRAKTNLKLWLDKKDLLPGQSWNLEIRKAIKNSRYFIALFSSTSVQKRGYIQKEFKFALDVFDEFPEGEIFAIPVRLDNCETPYEKFKNIERVDLFPDWNEGVQRLLGSIIRRNGEQHKQQQQKNIRDCIKIGKLARSAEDISFIV